MMIFIVVITIPLVIVLDDIFFELGIVVVVAVVMYNFVAVV